MDLTTNLDDVFLQEIASRFPQAAYSCLYGSRIERRLQSAKEWLGQLDDDCLDTIEDALKKQLGHLWTGLESEPPLRQTVLILFGAHANGEDVSTALADMNAWAAAHENGITQYDTGILMSGTLREAARPVIATAGRAHAWSETIALALIRRAKESGGVMPNGHYVWLAKYDRPLWLLLDGYGRHEPAVEILGVFAHEAAERIMGEPLAEPLLGQAVDAVLESVAGV